MENFFLFVAACLAWVLNTIWFGYVASVLWKWFVVPTFNAPALSIPVALGIAVFVKLLTYTDTTDLIKNEADTDTQLIKGMISGFLIPTFALIAGYIYLQFV